MNDIEEYRAKKARVEFDANFKRAHDKFQREFGDSFPDLMAGPTPEEYAKFFNNNKEAEAEAEVIP